MSTSLLYRVAPTDYIHPSDCAPLDLSSVKNTDKDIRSRVRRVISHTMGQWTGAEHRKDRRYPYPQLILLRPLLESEGGSHTEEEQTTAVGHYLSESGLSFYHTEPLSHRRMIVSLQANEADTTQWDMLIDLTWCRFLSQGWYESGGRLYNIPE